MRKDKRYLMPLVVGINLLMLSALLFLTHLPSQAKEVRYPVPCYEGEELAKVREWEKTWVGKKIDPTNIDGVKEFIPDNYYQVIKQPDVYGAMSFEIVPYKQIKSSTGLIKATHKYAGTATIGPDEDLHNWVAGVPFPEPKTVLEIMWNFDKVENTGDTTSNRMVAFVVDGRRGYDRNVERESSRMWFTGRTEVEPIPEILPNKKKIRRASHFGWLAPPFLKGGRGVSIKWKDSSRDWGSWGYSAATRRVVRRSTAERQNTAGGADLCMDDDRIYAYKIPAQTYKLLGRKELLLPRDVDKDAIYAGHKEGECLDSGSVRERINTYVVEAVYKKQPYLYSKSVYYIDPETWWIIYSDKYDKRGKLWKVFDFMQTFSKSLVTGEEIPWVSYAVAVDVQRIHATTGQYTDEKFSDSGKRYTPAYYTPKALTKVGY